MLIQDHESEFRMNVKVLALDLDGTVFGRGPLNLEEVVLLRKLQARGIGIVLCSGRTLHYVMGIARCLGTTGPLVCEEGTIVYDQNHHQKIINGDITKIRELRGSMHRLLPLCRIPRESHHDKEVILALDREPRIDLDTFETEIKQVLERNRLDLNVTSSDEMINVIPAGIDKGFGLQTALSMMGLREEGIIAIGDAPNDIPLLKRANYAAAVANAHPRVKEIVDFVSRFDDGEGVSELAQHILDNKI